MPDNYMVINGMTYHFDRLGQNEENVGVGYERRDDNLALSPGVLKDSFGNWSPYLGGSLFMDPMGPVSLGLTGTLSHRKEAEHNVNEGLTFAPMLTGEIMITDEDGVNIGIIPPLGDKTGGLAMLQYKHLLGDKDKTTPAGDELEERLGGSTMKQVADLAKEGD